MITSALFFPRTTISEDLLKNALLLWDQVEFISPSSDHWPRYEDKRVGAAAKLIMKARPPKEEAQRRVDEALVELLDREPPAWLLVDNLPAESRSRFWPQKLARNTWKMLEGKKLAAGDIGDGFDTSVPIGLTIMSLLATEYAGSTRRPITDETASYAQLSRVYAAVGGAALDDYSEDCDRLVTLTLEVLDFKNVSLERLVQLRKKEKGRSGKHLRKLRHGYLRRIEKVTTDLGQVTTMEDRKEIERQFRQEMEDDLGLLRDELKDEAKKVIFSKEIGAAVLATAGALVEPTAGLLIAGGALGKKMVNYRTVRNKALYAHPMSWLYTGSRRLQIW